MNTTSRRLIVCLATLLALVVTVKFVIPALVSTTGENRAESSTKARMGRSGPIQMCLDTFHLDMGRYPRDFVELTTRPSDDQDKRCWQGPYVKDLSYFHDGWGNMIRYQCPSGRSDHTVDLWSDGADGQPGTADDLVN